MPIVRCINDTMKVSYVPNTMLKLMSIVDHLIGQFDILDVGRKSLFNVSRGARRPKLLIAARNDGVQGGASAASACRRFSVGDGGEQRT